MTSVVEGGDRERSSRLWLARLGKRAGQVQARVPVIQGIAIVVCVAYAAGRVPGFTSKSSILTIAVLASFLALSAVGQTLVIMLGGIDLSVGSMIGFGAVLVPYYASHWHLPFLLVAVVGVAVCGLIGVASGWLSYHRGVHSLMITLAVGACVDGWVLVSTRGNASSPSPSWLAQASVPTGKTFGLGIPPIVAGCLVVTALSVLILARTKLGRRVYATGANGRAALYALARPDRIWIGSFALSAAVAAAVGVFLGGFSGNGDTTVGTPYLFEGIAAVVVGGTVFGGGRGDYLRTVVGALFLTVLSTALVSLNVGPADTQILSGLLILVVVVIYSRERSARSAV